MTLENLCIALCCLSLLVVNFCPPWFVIFYLAAATALSLFVAFLMVKALSVKS